MSDAAWLVLALVVPAAASLGLLVSRVRSLGRRIGSFECALRRGGRSGWTGGIASFGLDRLDWYRLLSFSLRPAQSWSRSELRIVDRAVRLSAGKRTSIVEANCCSRDAEFTLAMSEQAYAGLTSWLEAAPPGGAWHGR